MFSIVSNFFFFRSFSWTRFFVVVALHQHVFNPLIRSGGGNPFHFFSSFFLHNNWAIQLVKYDDDDDYDYNDEQGVVVHETISSRL